MLNLLKQLLNSDVRAASKGAARFYGEAHPGRSVLETRLRSDEPDRLVFAVFYEGKETVRPSRYSIVAVEKDTQQCEELEMVCRRLLRTVKAVSWTGM